LVHILTSITVDKDKKEKLKASDVIIKYHSTSINNSRFNNNIGSELP